MTPQSHDSPPGTPSANVYNILRLDAPGKHAIKARHHMETALARSARKLQSPLGASDPVGTGSETTPRIPPLFFSALAVRNDVFIIEQNCSEDEEPDSLDGVSFHWVLFAGLLPARPGQARGTEARVACDEVVASMSELGRMAVKLGMQVPGSMPAATLRLVPYVPGYGFEDGQNSAGKDEVQPPQEPKYSQSTLWDQREPFVKLGRLATLEQFRGRGYGQALIEEALSWAQQNSHRLCLSDHSAKHTSMARWQGLVCAHAQVQVVPWYCDKVCFQLDTGIEAWWEEDIEHRAVWRRVELEE